MLSTVRIDVASISFFQSFEAETRRRYLAIKNLKAYRSTD